MTERSRKHNSLIMEKFGKVYKLCSRKVIGSLFKEGKQLRSYPFAVHYNLQALDTPVSFQVVLSAPKRNFKRAHDRNYIKRLLREAMRKEKGELEEWLKQENKQLALFILYNQRDMPDYHAVEKGMQKLLAKILNELQESVKKSNI